MKGAPSRLSWDITRPNSTPVWATTTAPAGTTNLLAYHGAPDAPTVDVQVRFGPILVDDLAYTDFQGYLNAPATDLVIEVDVDGTLRSLADPEFAGNAMIIEIFGTWCPNCHDLGRALTDLLSESGRLRVDSTTRRDDLRQRVAEAEMSRDEARELLASGIDPYRKAK